MAARAYVLINASAGAVEDLAASLRCIEGVSAADVVVGPYDIVVVLEASDTHAIGQIMLRQFHRLPGIMKTLTMVVVE